MKINDFSEIKLVEGKLSFQDRVQGISKYGFSWPKMVYAQNRFADILQREIDTHSTLICNFTLPEVEVTVPFILIGPPGIRIILVTLDRGMFRAKEGQWLAHSGKGFRPAKENLIRRAQLYIKAVQKFLSDHGFSDIVVDGLIVGIDPGMHVETHRSAVRVIQSDAIRRFAAQWEQDQPELDTSQIYQITSTIARIAAPEPELEEETPRVASAEPREDKFAKSLEPLQKTFNFTPKQWAILGVLGGATVCILLIFILFIILSL